MTVDCGPAWVMIGVSAVMLLAAGACWLDAWRLCRRVRRIARQALDEQDAFWAEVNERLVEREAAR